MRHRAIVIASLVIVFTVDLWAAECDPHWKYRSLDGYCNNLNRPTWGTPHTPYNRLLPSEYGDGLYQPRVSRSGSQLPNARQLSLTLFSNAETPDDKYTLLNMQFGQLVAHDMSLTQGVLDALACCRNGTTVDTSSARCLAIPVAPDDPVYGSESVQCLELIRTLTDQDVCFNQCFQGRPAEQINEVTSFLDLSVVYGESNEESYELREFTHGRLKVEQRLGADWPQHSDSQCITSTVACYRTGDRNRGNQSPHLGVLQITFMREHNRIAGKLRRYNPHWSDLKLFQEARRINIAQYQHIVYYEWLPNFLGYENMIRDGLINRRRRHADDYDDLVNPSTLNSHATGAFRYFHTRAAGHLSLKDETRAQTDSIRISDHFFNMTVLEQGDQYADLARGLATQPMHLGDRSIDYELQNHLFRFNKRFGSDLMALDIQRSRDHGLAGYNAFREYCGFPKATTWQDYNDVMNANDTALLATLYETVDDLDLPVGLQVENPIDDANLGPVLTCILTEQFRRTRRSDRFFFETRDHAVTFHCKQLKEIRKASIARILCDNTPHVKHMQPQAFEQLSESNVLKQCCKLPSLNLKYWIDDD